MHKDVFDIALKPCEPPEIISDMDLLVDTLVKTNAAYSARKCFKKIGMTIANGSALIAATRKIDEKQVSEKKIQGS